MASNLILNPGKLLKASGLGAIAVALAMMALPADAFAQNGRGNGGQSAQSSGQSSGRGGGWNGSRGMRGDGGGQTVRSQSRGQSWNGNRGNAGTPRAVRQESTPRSATPRAWNGNRSGNGATVGNRVNRNPVQSQGQNWRNRSNGNGVSTDRSAARAAQVQRRRESDRNWSNQQQWTQRERNRSYTDNNRNRTYRDRGVAGRSDSLRNDPGRWNNNNRNWGNNGNRWSNDSRRWDRNWRRDNRYDWMSYRTHNRDIYRLGRYYAPYRNYSYRRVGIGFQLDSLFFGSRYWLDDPSYYRLPPADGPYRWIRYYDDALLVDTYSGEVIDVIENFFW